MGVFCNFYGWVSEEFIRIYLWDYVILFENDWVFVWGD